MRRTVALAATTLFLAAGSALAQDSANLGPTFTKGEKARYQLTNTAKQNFSGPQGNLAVDVNTTLVIACEVTDVADDGGATVTATLEAIKSDFQSPMFTAAFDSASPPDKDASSDLAQYVRPIIGKSFTVKFSAGGANADINGIDAFLPPDQQMAPIVAQAIGANGLGTAVVGFYVLKDGMEPIAEGETWTDVQETSAGPIGSITITTNSKLESIESGVATVTVDGDAKFTPSAAAQQQGVSIAVDESTIDGDIHWSTDTDMLKDLESKSTIGLTMSMGGMSQTTRITNSSTAKRLD